MKIIEVEDDLYLYIASQTRHIGESASDILRRLLEVDEKQLQASKEQATVGEEINEPVSQVAEEASTELAASEDKAVSELNTQGIELERSSTKRFLALLSRLYLFNADSFAEACDIKGSKRVYFSTSLDDLLASGKTTKPQAIIDTPYYVITNTNTQRKRYILQHVAREMGLPETRVEELTEII